jgi:OPA family glycerol-3-phosphate transporter-like MFS transporter
MNINKAVSYKMLCGLCWLVYVSAYFGRVNLSIALPSLESAYGYSKTSLGILASGFFCAYAAGQLINGYLGDKFNPRYFVCIGVAAAALSNIAFVFSKNIMIMFLFWATNGYFQSMLWGPLVRIVSDYTPVKYLNRAMLFFSSSTVAGYLLSYTLVGKLSISFGWKTAFFIPGLTLLIIAFIWFRGLKGLQTQGGSLASDRISPDTSTADSSAARKKDTYPSNDMIGFLIRSRIWIIALVCVLEGMIKEGLTLWGPSFLSESRSLPIEKVLLIMSLAPFMNLLAIALSGPVNKFCRYKETRTVFCFMTGGIFFSAMMLLTFKGALTLFIIAICGLFIAIFAANNMLTAFVPLNFQKENRVSTVAGFLDCAVYIGAALAGPGIGALAEKSGWGGVIIAWIIVCSAGSALVLIGQPQDKRKAKN